MLKVCQYCGRVHEKKFDCRRKVKREKRSTQKDSFRSKAIWQKKREEIKKRDKYLCQACLHKAKGTVDRLNYNDLSVHHIVSLEEDFERRMDNDNLITLCNYHHERAEEGSISKEQLRQWIPPEG